MKDRYADNGLVGVAISHVSDEVCEIDTFLMSCRVIGRTVEDELLAHLTREALARGCRTVRGSYVPSAKNAIVADLYERFGFERTGADDAGITTWEYDLAERGPIASGFIAPAEGS